PGLDRGGQRRRPWHDVQRAAATRRVLRGSNWSLLTTGQANEEAPACRVRLGEHVAVDAAGEPAREREPETRACVTPAGLDGAANARLEDLLALFLCNARAVVLDRVEHRRAVALDTDPHAVQAVPARVLDHRLEDPLREIGVDADAQRLPGQRHLERHLPLLREPDARRGGAFGD